MQISEQCLRKLPPGKFVRFGFSIDMDGRKHDAVVWTWVDAYPYTNILRKGQFDIKTGEYLGDVL